MRPVVDRLYEEYGDKVHFAVLNPGNDVESAAAADGFGVRYVPTFIFVDSSGAVVEQFIGETAESELAAVLESLE